MIAEFERRAVGPIVLCLGFRQEEHDFQALVQVLVDGDYRQAPQGILFQVPKRFLSNRLRRRYKHFNTEGKALLSARWLRPEC